MRKLIDAIALFAGAVSLGFVVTGTVLYIQRDAIKAHIEGEIKEAIMGAIDMPELPGISTESTPSLPVPSL